MLVTLLYLVVDPFGSRVWNGIQTLSPVANDSVNRPIVAICLLSGHARAVDHRARHDRIVHMAPQSKVNLQTGRWSGRQAQAT